MQKITEIRTARLFEKHYKRLPRSIKEKAKEREDIFRADAFDPRLRTHKLHGKDKDLWAFWIDYHYRIKFLFLDDHAALFLDVGRHDRVY